ncbi:MAG: hypothetical protein A3G33_09010 [Omnitrophica bacterium RIFCSPLOWO2_12_FULL_44_17]|uniref:Mce/MlaD domain-containing protein n=1 Tax=Candidatus Danuiimicrobium aquiferis TaxID=1801832 RepID=A0A1G1L033_9BACT|nr:MAG: hypothetical protein A3B72_00100 [Omnitrophica bacterium RIFCSPHIGHO2_02_FULL_45_28]OGW91602.1 MAG: hypothetical protein A3E74_05115 [Omnitrophica bacterium RIFCSPHIGHO2_12_FULL_44_12]OGW98514.1 MAG: hypothetical protein A3G33_09010 [Omnitrophica bacterium RIFCSPLOWO2_12_FULL_44_17]OGX05066.1 MAG: hypothetical protein A3J12_08890 [Omnitrophica bacterium RIFCSPLOWO2_02_FULL_44_11]
MNKPKVEVAVGLFVVMAFIIAALIVFFVSGVYLFRPGYRLRAQFDYIGTINRGAPVRFSGVRVGEVLSFKIIKNEKAAEPERIEITLFIQEGVVVRENYPISIRGTFIMSEPNIEITPVPGDGRILKDGDVVKNGVVPISTDDMINRMDQTSKKIDSLLADVGDIFEDADMKNVLKDSLKNMNSVLASMNIIMVGHEDEFQNTVKGMNKVSNQLSELLGKINRAEGTLGKLVVEDEVYNDLRDFVEEIKKHPWRLFKKS